MRTAVGTAVAVGPAFLRGEVDADTMATTMMTAVSTYLEQERAHGSDGQPHDQQGRHLFGVIEELRACGGGYLAGRCDADCVARTMTELVRDFA